MMTEADKIEELLTEAKNLLHHTKCIDEDALKCPACSLESRIDAILPSIKDQAERIEALLKLVRSFDAAIQHIATPLGIACGGVDTEDNINPETGKPFGPGGHTGWVLTKAVTALQEKAGALKWILEEHGDFLTGVLEELNPPDMPAYLKKRLEKP